MFWFFYGLFVGAGVMRLLIWDLEGHKEITWIAWLLGILTLLLATFTIQTFIASFQEREPRAASALPKCSNIQQTAVSARQSVRSIN